MGFSIMEITQATSKQIVYISSVYKAVVQDFFVYYQRTSVKYILCTLILHVPSVIVYKKSRPINKLENTVILDLGRVMSI